MLYAVCTCSGPPSISDGTFNPRQGTYNCGAFVDYSCNNGFILRGSSRVTCNQNRQWGTAPFCERGKWHYDFLKMKTKTRFWFAFLSTQVQVLLVCESLLSVHVVEQSVSLGKVEITFTFTGT